MKFKFLSRHTFSSSVEAQRLLQEQALREEEELIRIAREERERLKAEEQRRFVDVTERLNHELEIKEAEFKNWKVEQFNKQQVLYLINPQHTQ